MCICPWSEQFLKESDSNSEAKCKQGLKFRSLIKWTVSSSCQVNRSMRGKMISEWVIIFKFLKFKLFLYKMYIPNILSLVRGSSVAFLTRRWEETGVELNKSGRLLSTAWHSDLHVRHNLKLVYQECLRWMRTTFYTRWIIHLIHFFIRQHWNILKVVWNIYKGCSFTDLRLWRSPCPCFKNSFQTMSPWYAGENRDTWEVFAVPEARTKSFPITILSL